MQGIQQCTDLFQAFCDSQQSPELGACCVQQGAQLQVQLEILYEKQQRIDLAENVVIFLNFYINYQINENDPIT